ncbi:MAG: hypothetical protein F4Y50_08295 [Dehalococcoidia bacterium]|nr:hypothetical protein [Dehalococcoidia bacterium]
MTLLTDLGISTPYEAAELELELGVRFDDFTPEDADTWKRQTLYLNQYARTRTFTHAARAAGVSLRTARTWQTDNTLGFNQRLEIAVLEYTEEIEVILLEQVRQPKPSPALLAMLLRAHLPEKYGPARRDSAPRDNHHDHDDNDPKPETSQEDRESLEDIRRDVQDLKLFAGLTQPPDLSPHPQGEGEGEGKSSPSASSAPSAVNPPTPSPVLGESLSRTGYGGLGEHETPDTHHSAPTLNRRQRRQLQRKQRKQLKHAPYPDTGTKQPNSHRARAPN